ncbi:ankyrin repeat protein [Mucilaginibacter yixingensis]|uniref:Ankyrin repeat protein n=1 Tax=Mucilaginibacter yixingensis TaxID=1295612 RepID=A0A2T5J6P0_9SPHI|nr:ankyrin repeat domain-containing protein [Mucilaginibacter yixingensis]PTQ94116.1 ankyrin repeat protein [Mucilaginibacter yixingensis]
MGDHSNIITAFERHDTVAIENYFKIQGNPNEMRKGEPLFNRLVDMYSRSPKFKECVRIFINYGLQFDDAPLLAVLANDADKLEALIKADPEIVHRTYNRFKCTFTPLNGGTLLHFSAEYRHLDCATVLLNGGADINARASLNENGFGGHTPIFHLVNSLGGHELELLHLFLKHVPDLSITVKGLIWGKGYEWETFIPAVNPLSYTMMGLLPQMHRDPITTAKVVSALIKQAYGIDYQPPNVPNAYLNN